MIGYAVANLFSANEWVHVGIMLNVQQQSIHVYKNGVSFASTVVSSIDLTTYTHTRTLSIGRRWVNSIVL